MPNNDKKLLWLVWVGVALLLLFTFGKLFWVDHLHSTGSEGGAGVLELVIAGFPLGLFAVVVGVVISRVRWRRRDKSK